MTKNIIIAVLVVIILLLLWAMDPRGIFSQYRKKVSEATKVRTDSVLVAEKEIIALLARERALIEKNKADSARRADERLRDHKEIKQLRKRLSEIKFDGTTSLELDSIRNVIYPPDDSTYIVAGPDPLYSMPISQARDALEAKAREPFRDSIEARQDARIEALEVQADSAAIACTERLAVKDSVYDASQIANRNLAAVSDYNRKEAIKQHRLRWFDRLGGFILGALGGRASK